MIPDAVLRFSLRYGDSERVYVTHLIDVHRSVASFTQVRIFYKHVRVLTPGEIKRFRRSVQNDAFELGILISGGKRSKGAALWSYVRVNLIRDHIKIIVTGNGRYPLKLIARPQSSGWITLARSCEAFSFRSSKSIFQLPFRHKR